MKIKKATNNFWLLFNKFTSTSNWIWTYGNTVFIIGNQILAYWSVWKRVTLSDGEQADLQIFSDNKSDA